MSAPDSLPYDRVAAFIRLLTHDFRNALNSFDLQASLLREIVTDPEALDELGKMRQSVTENAARLQRLGARFSPINPDPISVPLDLLMDDLRARVEKRFPGLPGFVSWPQEKVSGNLETDYELLCTALLELFDNAAKFQSASQPVTVQASAENNTFRLSLIEAKPTPLDSDPATWGEPFQSSRRGGYGLGLFHARRIVTALGGTLTAKHEDNTLTSTVTLPHAGA